MSPYRVNLSRKRWICLNCYIYFFIVLNLVLFILSILATLLVKDKATFQTYIEVLEIMISVEVILQALSFSIISCLIMRRLKLHYPEFYK